MKKEYYVANRQRLYDMLKPASLLMLFAGEEVCKTNDEAYPFFAERDFVYMTGIKQKESVLLAMKDASGTISERMYMLPPDTFAERWTGRRFTPAETEAVSGISDVCPVNRLAGDVHMLACSGNYENIYLDLFRANQTDRDRPAQIWLKKFHEEYPYLQPQNANLPIRTLRTIKQPCEIAALRRAEEITGEGILAMMRASRTGMYEYQYKAEFEHVLGQYSPDGPGFPSIISAGKNNFCIHYYSYTGQAQDGDMVLNDVGAQSDDMIVDVSRAWPCNGKFTGKQRLLYECALATSDYMFSIIKPGMKMRDVDATIRNYNAQRMKDAGVIKNVDEIGVYMWHGGAHHIGYDVHDVVETPEAIAPGMTFCVDVGIYHEEWGIGFRLEDNCLVTETGCENLSRHIPRTISDIENIMGS